MFSSVDSGLESRDECLNDDLSRKMGLTNSSMSFVLAVDVEALSPHTAVVVVHSP